MPGLGIRAMRPNGVAVMREIEPGLFAGSVQNKRGTTRGNLTGLGSAELTCGVSSLVTRQLDAEVGPRRLPPRRLSDIGANAVVRWNEWGAREE